MARFILFYKEILPKCMYGNFMIWLRARSAVKVVIQVLLETEEAK